jgi:cytoskeletal protein CcmA (bactofilin family)
MAVGGNLYLVRCLAAKGSVRLPGASISGRLVCSGAKIYGRNAQGNSLMADRISVSGSVFLDEGFVAVGAVRLMRARINGRLRCSGAHIDGANDHGNALAAGDIKVGSDVFLDKGFRAEGAVEFSQAQIEGRLTLEGAILAGGKDTIDGPNAAFVAEGTRIAQQLVWAPAEPVTGAVSLERTHLHHLDDHWNVDRAHWPRGGRLSLAGLTYDGFGGEHRAPGYQKRLEWIRGQAQDSRPRHVRHLAWIRGRHRNLRSGNPRTFVAQPYEQLARVYRQAGRPADAREISIAQRNDLRKFGELGRFRRMTSRLLDVTIRHGYKTSRAVVMLLAVFGVALGMATWAQHTTDILVPAKDPHYLVNMADLITAKPARHLSVDQVEALPDLPTAADCTKKYPCFSPLGYAIDITLPIIQTGQAETWHPNRAADWGWVMLVVSWTCTGLGWAFTTLAVAGYTGLVRKE